MKKVPGVLAGAVALMFAASAGFAADAIKVGFVDTYTGPATAYTNDVLDGFKLRSGRSTRRGRPRAEDRVRHPGRQVQARRRADDGEGAILRENVDLLVGTISSAVALAVSDLAKKGESPFIVTYAKSDKITGSMGHRYVFSMNENSEMAGRAGEGAGEEAVHQVLDRRRRLRVRPLDRQRGLLASFGD